MLHVDIPTRDDLQALLLARHLASVTICLPTTPVTAHAQADRIALKNQTADAVGQLEHHDKREVRALEEALLDLVDDDVFWEFQANSLVVLATPAHVHTYRLPNRLPPSLQVSDRFHLKPLLRAVSAPQAAFVLALAQNSVRVVEVSADLPAFSVKVSGMPASAASAAGKASINDRSPSGRIQGDEGKNVRLVQYARQVDQALREVLAGRETPLILAAAEPLRSLYRAVQSYPHLAGPELSGNPEAASDAELAAAARPVLDELFQSELAALRSLFAQRATQGRTTTDVAQAARAATNGAVQTLLVDIDQTVPGTLDEEGAVTFADRAGPKTYDLIDEIAGRAVLTGARVLAVRGPDLPGGGSLAAILRYPF